MVSWLPLLANSAEAAAEASFRTVTCPTATTACKTRLQRQHRNTLLALVCVCGIRCSGASA